MVGTRNQTIIFDINSTPLQVITDSDVGGGDTMHIRFSQSKFSNNGKITVRFSDIPTFSIDYCAANEISLSKLGNNSNRVWTIKKDLSRLRLSCNGEEIFDIDTQPIINTDCMGQWPNDLTVVMFMDDTASDFYRQYTNGEF